MRTETKGGGKATVVRDKTMTRKQKLLNTRSVMLAFISSLAVMVFACSVFGGDRILSGRVTDERGRGLFRVMVTAKAADCRTFGTTQTYTSVFGYYSLLVRDDCPELVIVPRHKRYRLFTPTAWIFSPGDIFFPWSAANFIVSITREKN